MGHTKLNMNPLEKEVAPLSTFESKLIKENQNLLKKLDQQTQRITEQTQQIAEQLLSGVKGYHHCDGYSGYKNLPNIE